MTGYHWLKKAFLILKDYRNDIKLSEAIWIDETCVPVWKSKRKKKVANGYRGLSQNQCCIYAGTDANRCFLVSCGTGKESSDKILTSYKDHIMPGARLMHEGERSHKALLERLGLTSIVFNSRKAKKFSDARNPIEPINGVHRMLKRFLESHNRYSEGFKDWLNLFYFIWNEKGTNEQKAQAFLEIATKTKLILRYRTWKESKKADDYDACQALYALKSFY